MGNKGAILFGLFVVCLAVAVGFIGLNPYLPQPTTCNGSPSDVRVFTAETIAAFKGQTPLRPLLLVVLGDVFDVSEGARFYQQGEGYHCFIGQDNSRAFSTGKFDEVHDEVLDMDADDVKTVVGWLSFYQKHKSYSWVGVMAGRYYDCEGKPTPERTAVFNKANDEVKPTDDEMLLGRQQFCQISSSGTVSTLACHKGRSPRLLRYAGGRAGGCVCADDSAIDDFRRSSMSLEAYPGCGPTDSECKVPIGG